VGALKRHPLLGTLVPVEEPSTASTDDTRGFDLSPNKHALDGVWPGKPSPERLTDKISGKAAAGLKAATAFSLRAQTAAITPRAVKETVSGRADAINLMTFPFAQFID